MRDVRESGGEELREMLCFSIVFVAAEARKVSSEKRELRRMGRPRCQQNLHRACARERFARKKAPRCMFAALFEVEPRKICTTLWRESDLEVKIVKNWQSRDVFEASKCVSRGRVAKTLAGVVDLKRVRNDAFRVAGRDFVLCNVDVWSFGRWIRGRVANFMLQKCYSAGMISRVAVAGVQ